MINTLRVNMVALTTAACGAAYGAVFDCDDALIYAAYLAGAVIVGMFFREARID